VQRTRLQRAAAKRAQDYRLSKTVNAYGALYKSLLSGGADSSVSAQCGGMLG
jgi:hypothetical protein